VARPAILYALCALASWMRLAMADARGIDTAAIGSYLLRAVTPDFLVFSTSDAHTWTTAQLTAGVGLYLAALAAGRTDPLLTRRIARAIGGSMAVLAVVTCGDVLRQWAGYGYDTGFLLRYLRGERFALHLPDVNAAGSQYVLAAGIAATFALAGRGRRLAVVAIVTMLPAYWLTGSRTAWLSMAGALATLAAARKAEWRITRAQAATGALLVALGVAALVAVAAFGGDERGDAGRAIRLRTQFSETSLRMLASAPVFGVGVGHYFPRSPEFMPSALRELYGAENAHNYFAQEFAELGIVGGLLFAWTVASGAGSGWRRARAPDADTATRALLVGCGGYLLTCLTGHPLLVSEAALPFWVALGVLASHGDGPAGKPAVWRVSVALILTLLVVDAGRGAAVYLSASEMPQESGFERSDISDDGRAFRWTSPHATTYVPDGLGFLQVVIRAPEIALPRPMTVEISVAGRVVDRRELPRGRWETIQVPVRTPASARFRRVDVRVTPFWTEKRQLARRTALIDVSLGAMVAEVRWVTPRDR
jgi:hypothetical protein